MCHHCSCIQVTGAISTGFALATHSNRRGFVERTDAPSPPQRWCFGNTEEAEVRAVCSVQTFPQWGRHCGSQHRLSVDHSSVQAYVEPTRLNRKQLFYYYYFS